MNKTTMPHCNINPQMIGKSLITLCFSMALVACGGGSSAPSSTGNTSATPTPAPAPTPAPTPTPTPAPTPPSENLKVLAIGDSFFAWNTESQQSIPDEIGKTLSQSVENRAVSGAMISGGDADISNQYTAESWDWVVLNGGGNDLNDKCSCNDCSSTMNALISMDANSGEIPTLVNRILQDGSKVAIMQYPELLPDAQFGFAACDDEFVEMTFRLNQLALNNQNVWLVEARDVVPTGDDSYFDTDKVHPSTKGSQVIGQYIAQTINGG